MLGCIYLILAVLLGREFTRMFLKENEIRAKRITPLWVTFPAAFGCGTLFLTWAVYVVAWLLSVYGGAKHPLTGANLIVQGLTGVVLLIFWYKRKTGKPVGDTVSENMWHRWIRSIAEAFQERSFRWEVLFFTLLLFWTTWIMFYVFHIKNGVLYSGYSVFGDYAPHTAMIRSFSLGNNFPTQYPHFGGEDVKYHFMFQFLAGNLEYLGMRLDVAYNSVSILALWGFFMMLYSMAKRISGKIPAGILSVVFLVFRSGTAFFQFAYEHWQAGDLAQTLLENTSFIGYTANENWGLWNFNVYLNQRHLSFGLLLSALALWIFWEWVEKGCAHEEKGILWLKNRLFTKIAWMWIRPEDALFVGLFLGLCSFWNGAAVIGCLLILMGFAIFSDGKLDYLLTALVTVGFSLIQSKIFVNGSVVSPSLYFGFLAENKTLPGVLLYLFEISGVTFIGILVLVFFLKREERSIAISMLFPVIFTFCVSLTPDINVNHKYVMISYAFLTIFWAKAVTCLFYKKNLVGKMLGLVLTLSLTVTGIYDFVVILKDNDAGHRVGVNLNSDLTSWLSETLKKDDLILTPEYSINEVTMSGVMLYLGWPYYAWSAGYDTYDRAAKAVEMYTTEKEEALKELVKNEHITYILFEEGMEFEQHVCREDVIQAAYPLVYQSEDGRIRIYGTEE